jgi:PAS domain S-box-containing protein
MSRANRSDVTDAQLEAELAELRLRLEEAEEALRAIREGAVDAFVVTKPEGNRIYTLESADRPYRLLVERMQQGALTLFDDGTIAYSNQHMATLLGVAHAQLAGVALDDFVAEDELSAYHSLLRQGQTGTSSGEIGMCRADGIRLPVYLTINVLPADSGAAIGVLVTDLTLQKHHEQLAAAQEALRAADRRKDEFLATLAHELRGPLAPIINSLAIMKRADIRHPMIEQARSTMERQLEQMTRLVDDLLDISRITSDKLELRAEPVELSSVISQATETCRPAIEKAQQQLSVSLPSAPLYLHGDPVRLAQVFSNLLHNASKYTEARGRISISAAPEGADVVVSVRDTGVGIPAAMLSRVFEPFTQIDRTLESAYGGLGIGLALVRRLVEMHGGSVRARSDGVGQGSEFIVRLPAVTAPATAAREPSTDTSAARTARRILVVDDNQDSAESLALLLELSGHEVRTAHDGVEGVEAAATFRPDVILLDIGLPKLNGYEAARRIREQQGGKQVVLVAVTGWGQEEDRRRSGEAGFDAHMVKPVDPNTLGTLLAQLPTKTK